MPKIDISVAHDHGRSGAIEKLKSFSQTMRDNMPEGVSDVEESWTDEGTLEFKVKGMGMEIAGVLEPSDKDVQLTGKLPFAALPFRGLIESQLKTGLEDALG
jgi:hypothetical protein